MKINKILKMVLATLIIVLVAAISFGGIFVKDKGKYSNVVKDYQLGMDLKGSREVKLKVSDATKTINYDANGKEISSTDTETEVATSEEKKVNDETILNSDNYKLSKKILENRLNAMKINYYETRLDEENGSFIINIPENEDTDTIVAQLQYQGKFEILDNDTQEVLMTNDDLKSVKAGYGSTSSSSSGGTTVVFLDLQFNKEGTEKFKNITNTYVETTTTDSETGEEKTNTKEIKITIDDSALLTTHFDKEISNGLLQLSVGSSSTSSVEELQESYKQANNLAALLNNGKMPIVYTTDSNQYIASQITNENIAYFISLCIVGITGGMIYLVIKHKDKGIIAIFYLIFYIAILLLIIRYTNVVITVSGLVAISISFVLAYMAMINRLYNYSKTTDKKEAYKKSVLQTLLILVPVCIIAIVFTFNSWQPISSFGMITFWGSLLSILYML